MTTFHSEGAQLRDEALDRLDAAHAQWIEYALNAIRSVARNHQEFTTDTVWALCERKGPPPERRAMGAVMRKAVAEKLCQATTRTVNSTRADCHRRPIRVWESLVYKGTRIATTKRGVPDDIDRLLNHAGAIGLLCEISVHLRAGLEHDDQLDNIERCVSDYAKLTGGSVRRVLNRIEYSPPEQS